MPKCRHCHAAITRLDKEICPYCGGLSPLEGADDLTEDVTQMIQQVATDENKEPIRRSRKVTGLLALFLGIFGAHQFYLGKWKRGILILCLSLVFIFGSGTLLYLTVMTNVWAYLLPYSLLEGVMIIIAITCFTRHDLKDAKGDYLC